MGASKAKIKVIDLFCGAGGTSLGFDRAELGGEKIAEVLACVNHDALAIRSHSANFPQCQHFTEDVRNLDVTRLPRKKMGDNSIWILWASLECTHFSNAKTGARNADSRTLAHALYPYIQHINPDYIMIENVREFMSWGELCEKGKPIDRKKGIHYVRWREKIESFGYRYASRLLNSADYGSHQSRLRYFAIFARPNMPIVFPQPTHEKHGKRLPKWKPVREVLNLHDAGQSIFNRKKPLSPNTMRRILAGLVKFVANGQPNYLLKHYGGNPSDKAVSVDQPAPTITTIPHESIVTADFLCQYNGTPHHCNFSTCVPCRTITTKDRFGYVSAAFIMPTNYGNGPTSIDYPLSTITANRKWQYLVNPQFNSAGGSVDAPCFTLIAKMDKRPPSIITADVEPKNPGTIDLEFFKNETVSPEDRIAVFMHAFGIRDIFMRMLNIPELKRIQGLGDDYVLLGPKNEQKKFIGNAVVPDVVKAWAESIYMETISAEPPKLEMCYAENI